MIRTLYYISFIFKGLVIVLSVLLVSIEQHVVGNKTFMEVSSKIVTTTSAYSCFCCTLQARRRSFHSPNSAKTFSKVPTLLSLSLHTKTSTATTSVGNVNPIHDVVVSTKCKTNKEEEEEDHLSRSTHATTSKTKQTTNLQTSNPWLRTTGSRSTFLSLTKAVVTVWIAVPPLSSIPDTAAAIMSIETKEQAPTKQFIFETKAYGRQEYTNSITASRDTNISPAEAYDILRQQIPTASELIVRIQQQKQQKQQQQQQQQERDDSRNALSKDVVSTLRVADVGAGAGLSTAVLFNELGYHFIDAIDWSRLAWDDSVVSVPSTVHFYELDDDRFFLSQEKRTKDNNTHDQYFDVIVYNFAINADKARRIARNYLRPSSAAADASLSTATSLLLAPCNDRRDYWYKQTYLVFNSNGDVLWKSLPDVGAWSIQFQPDVTSQTCTGIWCGNINGYQSKSF